MDEEEAVWKEYITIPINDQGAYDKNEGGCRWSLLTFNRDEKTWYLMDSHKSDETMKKEAKNLAKRMNDYLFEYREEKTWCLMDSHKSDETMEKEAKKLTKRMNDYLFEYSEEKTKFVVSDCSKQNNGYNCGAFVMPFFWNLYFILVCLIISCTPI